MRPHPVPWLGPLRAEMNPTLKTVGPLTDHAPVQFDSDSRNPKCFPAIVPAVETRWEALFFAATPRREAFLKAPARARSSRSERRLFLARPNSADQGCPTITNRFPHDWAHSPRPRARFHLAPRRRYKGWARERQRLPN